jgi:hypothetical protein
MYQENAAVGRGGLKKPVYPPLKANAIQDKRVNKDKCPHGRGKSCGFSLAMFGGRE